MIKWLEHVLTGAVFIGHVPTVEERVAAVEERVGGIEVRVDELEHQRDDGKLDEITRDRH
jgi:hypothetical protein